MSWSKLGVGLMRWLAWLPLPVLRALGWVLGRVLYVLAAPRRKVVLRNLGRIWPVADGDIDYEPTADQSVAAIAARTGVNPDTTSNAANRIADNSAADSDISRRST